MLIVLRVLNTLNSLEVLLSKNSSLIIFYRYIDFLVASFKDIYSTSTELSTTIFYSLNN